MTMDGAGRVFPASTGAVVKAWREARGWSLTELATRAGPPITKGYLSQVEHDKIQHPGDDKLAQLADTLGISVADLIARRLPGESEAHVQHHAVESLAAPRASSPDQSSGVPTDEDQRVDLPLESLRPLRRSRGGRYGSGYTVASCSSAPVDEDQLADVPPAPSPPLRRAPREFGFGFEHAAAPRRLSRLQDLVQRTGELQRQVDEVHRRALALLEEENQ